MTIIRGGRRVDASTDAVAFTRELVLTQLRRLSAAGTTVATTDPLAAHFDEVIREWWEGADAKALGVVTDEYRRVFVDAKVVGLTGTAAFDALVDDGWFRSFLDVFGTAKSAPQLLFGAALTFIAAGFGRRPLIEWQARPCYPNIYTLLIGGTGAGKGTAIRHAQRVAGVAMAANVLPNDGTMQGYAKHLASRYDETGVSSDGLIVVEEFETLFNKDRNKLGLAGVLADWYDHTRDVWERTTMGREYAIHNLCVTMLGASTASGLKRMPDDAMLGGFLPRFIMFGVREEDERWGAADPRFDESVLASLSASLTARRHLVPERVWLDRDGVDWLDAWYNGPHRERCERASGERVRKSLERKQSTLLKVAWTWQYADGGPTDAITARWLAKAARVLDWCDETVADVYDAIGTTFEGECAMVVAEWLRRRQAKIGARWIAENEITRAFRNRFRAPSVKSALEQLSRDGDAQSKFENRVREWRAT